MTPVEARADIVIIGAGIVGCALADELTRRGRADVVVLEQGPLFEAGGSTTHAPGLVFQTNPSRTMTALAAHTVGCFSALELDGEPCFHPVGSLEVAATPERLEDLRRKHGLATAWGVASAVIDPAEVARHVPLVDPERIHGALHVPSDGIAKALRAAEALARAASARGARFHQRVEVTGLEVEGGRVRAVQTGAGRIAAPLVVSAAGMWGPRIGRMAGVGVPLTPLQHQYARTHPVAGLDGTDEVRHPILRHQDSALYFRQEHDRYGIGSYQHRALPVDPEAIDTGVMAFTPEDFAPAWADTMALLPALGQAGLADGFNGLFSFTPDGMPLLGEARDARGLWLAEAVWITHSAGVARVVAEWICDGVPSLDLAACDLHRFERHALSPEYARARSCQAFREVYDIIHPQQPMLEPRPLRVSPFHRRQEELGAVFLEAAGWERPQWYAANAPLAEGRDIPGREAWAGRYWAPAAGAEHIVTRERVAVYDMAALGRLEVRGPGALDFLQGLCTNELDKPPGRVTFTLMLDTDGGIRSDVTVARLSDERFQIGTNGPRDLDWLERHLPAGGTVQVRDIAPGTCCLGVWGPLARELVQGLSEDDLSHGAFPYFHTREIHVREVPVTALRVSYVGELGWELYTTADLGLRLWDLLWQAGRPLGLIAGGRAAFTGLRIEKGYRLWGTDMTGEHFPDEAGLEFTVKPGKGDFVGRAALARRAGVPVRRLSCLTLDDPAVVVMGSEPVLAGGRAVGYVTSAAFGHCVGRSIAYAWLPAALAEPGTAVEIEYFGVRHAATVAAEPVFDPTMERMRSERTLV